jgi:membrane protease YdiL (CAAX protease family)
MSGILRMMIHWRLLNVYLNSELSRYKCLAIVGEGFLFWQIVHFMSGTLIGPAIYEMNRHLPPSTVATLIASDIAPLVTIMYMSLRLRGWFPELSFGINSVRGVIVGIFLAWIATFLGLVFFDKTNPEAQQILTLPKPYVYHGVFSATIWGPLLEEILTRGYFFEVLQKKWNTAFALVLSTLLFVVPHGLWGDWNATLVWITCNSLIYTFVYIEGGLWAAIITHSFVNSYILWLNV